MSKMYRNTLRAHAHALSCLGEALAGLAQDHRITASAVERNGPATTRRTGPRAERPATEAVRLPGHSQFADWIAALCEISTAAERLLELEIELARHYGVTWAEVADVLGVSRQAACERFGTHARWDRTHRTSRLRQARRAAMFRRMSEGRSTADVATLRKMLRVRPDGARRQSPAGDESNGYRSARASTRSTEGERGRN